MAKIINEDGAPETYETVTGEQVAVPKNVPWYESLGNVLAPPKLVDLEVPAPVAPTPEEIEANNAAKARMAAAKPFVPAGPEANAGPGTPTAPVAPMEPMAAPLPLITQSQMRSTSNTTANKTRPEDDARMARAEARSEAVVRSAADAEIAANDKIAAQMQLDANDAARRNELEVARKEKQNLEIRNRVADIDKSINELNGMTIDPSRLYGSMDTGNKIAAGIALFTSAFGAGATGSENLALGVLNKAIDRDIDAQKANMTNKTNVVTAKRGAYKDFLDMTGSEDAAKLAEEMRLANIAKTRLETISLTAKNPLIKNQAEKGLAALELDQARRQQELHKIVATNIVERQSETKQAAAPKPLDLAPNDALKAVTELGNGIKYLKDLEAKAHTMENTLGPVKGRIAAWKKDLGINTGDEAVLQQKILMSVAKKLKAQSGAAATDQEYQRLSQVMPSLKDNPKAFFAQLDEEISTLESEYDGLYESYKGVARLPNKIVFTSADKKAEDEAAGRVRK
jgi:hypothetical protein